MLSEIRDHERLLRTFRWDLPTRFNIAEAVCDRWADREPGRIALLTKHPGRNLLPTTYGELRAKSHALAAGLAGAGVRRGDRVALMLPQGPEAVVAHLAVSRLAAIALPIALVFGPDAVGFRLRDAGVAAVIASPEGCATLAAVDGPLPDLRCVVSTDDPHGGALDYRALLAAGGRAPAPDTGPDDPALMIYTSGTTGLPKGALHAGRVLLGHLPGFRMTHDFLPRPGDRAWTPADWAWAGGLLNLLMPALFYGVPVIAQPTRKFDPEAAFAVMEEARVRNAFVPPTALRLMSAVERPRDRFRIDLRTAVSAGETLGRSTWEWGKDALGVAVNEVYGQTECNYVLASCAEIGVSRPGSIGKPAPGHEVALLDEGGRPCAPEEAGQICVRAPDPVLFLGYWNQPEATAARFVGDWLTTGDMGVADADGYVRFVGRNDDVITSSGYRIGPGEIEDCLSRHPAVALSAVVGRPDALRTEVVKAFVQLKAGFSGNPELAAEISAFVRARLSAHEYPREIAFVAELPLTATGKVIRRQLRELE
jgi:acetyl-CoA synthetase